MNNHRKVKNLLQNIEISPPTLQLNKYLKIKKYFVIAKKLNA